MAAIFVVLGSAVGLGVLTVFGPAGLIVWLVFVALGIAVGARRQAAAVGFLASALLGPLGVLLVFAVDNRPKCPHCAESVQPDAKLCPHCRSQLARSIVRSQVAMDGEDWQNQHIDLTGRGRSHSRRSPSSDHAAATPETAIDSVIDEALGTNQAIIKLPPPPATGRPTERTLR